MDHKALPAAIAAVFVAIAGCTHPAKQLADSTLDYAKCAMSNGHACESKLPAGATAERKSVTTTNDGVSITVPVKGASDCAALVAAVGAPGYIVRAEVGGVVVRAFGSEEANKKQRDDQCQQQASPVVLTYAKAP